MSERTTVAELEERVERLEAAIGLGSHSNQAPVPFEVPSGPPEPDDLYVVGAPEPVSDAGGEAAE